MSPSKTEQTLVAQRYAKLEKIKALGCPLYPNAYSSTHALPQILEQHRNSSKEKLESRPVTVRVCGRVVAIRGKGKAGFLNLSDGEHRLQVYIRRDGVGERLFGLYRLLDVGDFLGVEGFLFRTRTGELTVHATGMEFLAKSLLPLPEKWHGLTDIEIRYRQRYLDLIANPGVREVFVTRSRIIRGIRDYLDERGYVEVETPMMQPVAGGGHRAALPHLSQQARHAAVSQSCAGTLPEATDRGANGTGLRDQPELPPTREFQPSTTLNSPCWSSISPTATIAS